MLEIHGGRCAHNLIDHFGHDAIKAAKDGTIVDGNCAIGPRKVGTSDHPDFFQIYNGGQLPFVGMKVLNNVFASSVGQLADLTDPLNGLKTQGMGIFDGPKDQLEILRNLITTTHTHGITALGVTNSAIKFNICANADPAAMTPRTTEPVIKVGQRPGTGPSVDVAVEDNEARKLNLNGTRVTDVRNARLDQQTTATRKTMIDTRAIAMMGAP